jgi:hypothetical protein
LTHNYITGVIEFRQQTIDLMKAASTASTAYGLAPCDIQRVDHDEGVSTFTTSSADANNFVIRESNRNEVSFLENRTVRKIQRDRVTKIGKIW